MSLGERKLDEWERQPFSHIFTHHFRPLAARVKAAPLSHHLPFLPFLPGVTFCTNPPSRDSDTSPMQSMQVYDWELANNGPCMSPRRFFCWSRLLLCHGPGDWSGTLQGIRMHRAGRADMIELMHTISLIITANGIVFMHS